MTGRARTVHRWTTIALLLGSASLAVAAPERVRMESFVSAAAVAPGGTFQVALRLSIDPGWHVQSHRPSEESFIATEMELLPAPGLTPSKVHYPEGEVLQAPALGGTLSVYSDGVIFGAEVAVAADAAAGDHQLTGTVRYQACNDITCLFPKTVDVAFPISVQPGAAPGPPEHPEIFDALTTSAAIPPPPRADDSGEGSEIGDQIASRGFSFWLVTVFVLGLGLNLTPCVYPVIAVTVSYFGRQGGGGALQLLRAIAYAAGIAATFTALFLVAGLSGRMFGSWLQNPWVLAGLAVVLVLLGLSNFGLFELQAPAALRNRLGGGRQGLLGALGMGLAMGIVAAPCVGPLIAGLLIWVGQQGSLATAGMVGGSLSAGLALPYVILGGFSGSLSRLPRSGDWMDWVKHLMGFVLFGVALYFLLPVMPSRWFLPAFAVLTLVAGVWLALFDRAGRSGQAMWFLRGAVFILAIGAAVLLLRLDRVDGIDWQPYSPDAVAAAAAEGRPVIIDFTAAWCLPCKVMEHGAFKDPDVVRESRSFVRLQVDLTEQEEPVAQAAVERYHIPGPPVIVFLAPDGREIADLRVLEGIGHDELLERMRQTRAASVALAN